MKKRLGIIGGGFICTNYKKGLLISPQYELIAICDKNENCMAKSIFDSIPFYTDYSDMLSNEKLDACLILTPPDTHFDIALDVLEKGYNCLIEKPMCDSLKKVKKLFDVANKNKRKLFCLFHWKYASEVLFLVDYFKKHNLKIKKIKTLVRDNYSDGKFNILPDKISLMGAWLDSGVNILSYADSIVDLKNVELIKKEDIPSKNSPYPVYSKRVFEKNGVIFDLSVDWRDNFRDKTSVITTDEGEFVISHTSQTVYKNGEMIFSSCADKRLSDHYENLFSMSDFEKSNESDTLEIHELLFSEVTNK